ncbi:MAG: gamma-glutamyltransferase [Mycobacterium sp.]|nr:gamma-glutamyltransferase [Mycobacterium sp.]
MMPTDRPTRGFSGIAVAPNALAAGSAVEVMRQGGNAIEAMVAAAATIAVVYPHMNSLGGDGFWLISIPGTVPIAVEACGAAGGTATIGYYRSLGLDSIPHRGPLAANTMAGTVSGWQHALELSRGSLGGRLPLAVLLSDAIEYAARGFPATRSQQEATATREAELSLLPGFAEAYLPGGAAPLPGEAFRQPALAETLRHLARAGLDDFYAGDIARSLAHGLKEAGAPIELADFTRHQAQTKKPLQLKHSLGTISNTAPPTQGLVSLVILGILDRLLGPDTDPLGAAYVHACVEATKLAFNLRDRVITDPDYSHFDFRTPLEAGYLDQLAKRIDVNCAADWGNGHAPSDTVWMGAIDSAGVAVSFIQSTYHEFGSGIVLGESGIAWQNRGSSFSLDPAALNPLMPGRKPFHTLNPAMAQLDDGRSIVYGSMGGDGQPQSQSAVFTRMSLNGWNPQAAVNAPRWVLGRTWGDDTDTLKLEDRFPATTVAELRMLGHEVEILGSYEETMGHAGALIRRADGLLEGGYDPRSDGGVAAW